MAPHKKIMKDVIPLMNNYNPRLEALIMVVTVVLMIHSFISVTSMFVIYFSFFLSLVLSVFVLPQKLQWGMFRGSVEGKDFEL